MASKISVSIFVMISAAILADVLVDPNINHVQLKEGELFYANCVNPAGSTESHQWLFNNSAILNNPNSQRVHSVHGDGYVGLRLLNLYQNDSGQFTCVEQDTGKSFNITLSVSGFPAAELNTLGETTTVPLIERPSNMEEITEPKDGVNSNKQQNSTLYTAKIFYSVRGDSDRLNFRVTFLSASVLLVLDMAMIC